MATKNCKDCGKEVSTSAQKCPHCGSTKNRKTHPFTWFVVFLIVLGIYSSMNSEPRQSASSNVAKTTTSNQSSKPAKPKPAPKIEEPSWSYTVPATSTT